MFITDKYMLRASYRPRIDMCVGPSAKECTKACTGERNDDYE